MVKKDISDYPIEHATNLAEEKEGKIKFVNLPASENKVYLIYKACEDCIHWEKCKKEHKNSVNTNKKAQKCHKFEEKK